MATRYRSHDGDMVDAICFEHYGRENAIIDVYEANRGLAAYGLLLPAGVLIDLPVLPTVAASPIKQVKLWD